MSADSDEPVFETRGVTVAYGGVTANDAIDLRVMPGEIVGLIGPNGAGKTSFIDAVSGFTTYTGDVLMGATRLDGKAPHRRRKLGLARTWQAGELFADLTVAQNIAVASGAVGLGMVLRDLGRLTSRPRDPDVERALGAVGLLDAADRYPTDLSLGEQKLVGVARAMAGDARVLLLDEPAAGLDTTESRRLGEQLRSIASEHIGALLVDHDMGLVLQLCDRIYVMDFGRIIASGRPDEVIADPLVVAAYLGSPETQVETVTT